FVSHRPAADACSTLSLHDALPIFRGRPMSRPKGAKASPVRGSARIRKTFTHLILSLPLAGKAAFPVPQGGGPQAPSPLSRAGGRSEEHTSELQSRENLVCRLLLEK